MIKFAKTVDEAWIEQKHRIILSGNHFLNLERTIPSISSSEQIIKQKTSNTSKQTDISSSSYRSIITAKGHLHGSRLKHKSSEIKIGENQTISSWHGTSKHYNNEFIRGLGKYGKKKSNDIISIINKITSGMPEKEESLANIILKALTNGYSSINKDIKNFFSDNHKPKQQQQFEKNISKFIYLLMVEVSRRPKFSDSVGYKKSNKVGKNNKTLLTQEMILFTQTLALDLIANGLASFKDFFDENSKYNIATGKKLRDIEESVFDSKLKNIWILYLEKNYSNELKEGNVYLTSEGIHQLLLKISTNKKETPGKNYLTPLLEDKYTKNNIITPKKLSFYEVSQPQQRKRKRDSSNDKLEHHRKMKKKKSHNPKF